MKKTKKNLKLNAETIRYVSAIELKDQVAGGASIRDTECNASFCRCQPSRGSTC